MLVALSIITVATALISFGVYLANVRIYQPAQKFGEADTRSVSVLIPARDEEDKIERVLNSVLASTDVDLELIVLDDHSEDRTAAIVESVRQHDDRVRLVSGERLPAGWCGKQYACWQLAQAARHELMLFIDADVQLAPTAISLAANELIQRDVSLLSGVPRQITSGFSDGLLIPLIHFILLSYLPQWINRERNDPALAAGCGQFFLTTKRAYEQTGGHSVIKASMHDGLNLPKSYRQAGESTDLIDLTDLVSCRMYERSSDVWSGLAKNAVEGIAAPSRIVPFSALLLGGHVAPMILLGVGIATDAVVLTSIAAVALALSYVVRLNAVRRFRQPVWSALLHPLGVAAFVGLQWFALGRHLLGHRPTWRGRGVASPIAVSNPLERSACRR